MNRKRDTTTSNQSGFRKSDSTNFDFKKMTEDITRCLNQHREDVDIKYYLSAYEELHCFLLLLGGAFSFVAADIKNKMEVLYSLRAKELQSKNEIVHFATVSNMIRYEKSENLLNQSDYVSGCRTLLRLHRGLDFLRKFLRQVYEADSSTKLPVIARAVYDSTLAEHHTWLVKNSARIAMQFLPTREELISKMGNHDKSKVNDILQSFESSLSLVDETFERIQREYKKNDLLSLP